MSVSLDQIVALAKSRGFIFPTSEIYGGLISSYDYGPLGSQLLKNIKDLWWHRFIEQRPDMVGIDSQIILRPETWVASGHVSSFTDPLVEDKVTHKRYRADHVIEDWLKRQGSKNKVGDQVVVEDLDTQEMGNFIERNKIKSPDGNELTKPKDFKLLFESEIGVVEGTKSKVYLRGETAQGIFTNFTQVINSTRLQLPFGVGQMGKSFRNEITTGQFVFRTLEFEQAEIEYFFDPEASDWKALMDSWKASMWEFVTADLHINPQNLRWRRHSDQERSHYSLDTYDLDYHFPFGWKELWGVAYRTDYDLKQHQQLSGKPLLYTDPHTGKKITPHVIEPALGINRALLMVLSESYMQDEANKRTVLKLPADIAPIQVAVFPLLKNKPELVSKAQEVFKQLLTSGLRVTWDDRGNIGKRYYYQDEIGTPWCVTIDFQSLEDNSVTVRNRDTLKQDRLILPKLIDHINKNLH